MHFIVEDALWLLAVVPLLGAAMVWVGWRRKQTLLKYFGEEELVMRFSKPASKHVYQFKAFCVFVALAAFIVSLSRPYLEAGKTEFPVGTVDVIGIVDVSRSMAAQDYEGVIGGEFYSEGTRLAMARYLIVNEVVKSLNMNQLGIVSFAGEAFPQAFVTDDMPALAWVLKRALTISSAPGEGSSLTKAFKLTFEMFDLDSDPSHRRVVVLFSDGGSDAGSRTMNEIANECRKRGIEVVVVGLGKLTPSAIPVSQLAPHDQEAMKQAYGGKKWLEVDGEKAMSALDENLLRFFANNVGGRYVRVENPSDFRLGSLISKVEVKYKPGKQELFVYPLMVGLLFMLLAYLTPHEPRDWDSERKDRNSSRRHRVRRGRILGI